MKSGAEQTRFEGVSLISLVKVCVVRVMFILFDGVGEFGIISQTSNFSQNVCAYGPTC